MSKIGKALVQVVKQGESLLRGKPCKGKHSEVLSAVLVAEAVV